MSNVHILFYEMNARTVKPRCVLVSLTAATYVLLQSSVLSLNPVSIISSLGRNVKPSEPQESSDPSFRSLSYHVLRKGGPHVLCPRLVFPPYDLFITYLDRLALL